MCRAESGMIQGMSSEPSARATRRTKLVATIGPASIGIVDRLIAAGLDIARINFSHGSEADHLRTAAVVREAAAAAGRPVGILADLPGPKLRLAKLHEDPVHLESGSTVALVGPDEPSSDAALPLADAAVPARLEPGDRVLLADGAAELRVGAVQDGAAVCEGVRCARCNDPGVAIEGLPRVRLSSRAEHVGGGLCCERVDVGCAQIGEKDHVTAFNGLEPRDARSVEADAINKRRGGKSGHRKRDVMPATGEVCESQVEHRDAHLVEKPDELGRVGRRAKSGRGFVEVPHRRSPVSVPHRGTSGHANERA